MHSAAEYFHETRTEVRALWRAEDLAEAIAVLVSQPGGGTWGSITGTLPSQADLQAALDVKQSATGWTADANVWTFVSADDPTGVIEIAGDATAYLGLGDRVQYTQTSVRKGIVHKINAYEADTAGKTRVYVYGGTDFTTANAAITAPAYSHAQSPVGFDPRPSKWTTTLTSSSAVTKASPSASTWYNVFSGDIPIGDWNVSFIAYIYTVGITAATGAASVAAQKNTLSTANNTESDSSFSVGVVDEIVVTDSSSGHTHSCYTQVTLLLPDQPLRLSAKTTYYMNMETASAACAQVATRGDIVPTTIRARSAYI